MKIEEDWSEAGGELRVRLVLQPARVVRYVRAKGERKLQRKRSSAR